MFEDLDIRRDASEMITKYCGAELRYLCEIARSRNVSLCTTCWDTSGDCECFRVPGDGQIKEQARNGRKHRRWSASQEWQADQDGCISDDNSGCGREVMPASDRPASAETSQHQ